MIENISINATQDIANIVIGALIALFAGATAFFAFRQWSLENTYNYNIN